MTGDDLVRPDDALAEQPGNHRFRHHPGADEPETNIPESEFVCFDHFSGACRVEPICHTRSQSRPADAGYRSQRTQLLTRTLPESGSHAESACLRNKSLI